MRRRWLLVAVLAFIISLTTIAQAQWLPVTEERRFTEHADIVTVQSNHLDVFIQETAETKRAIVQLSGPSERMKRYTLHATLKSGKLVVNVTAKEKSTINEEDVKLLIQLPQRKFAQLSVTTETGAVIVQSVKNERTHIETTNGSIVAKSLYVDEALQFISRDGDISVKDVHSARVTIKAAKGDILMHKVKATVKDVHTVGGELIQSEL